jgi:hypothetical protein
MCSKQLAAPILMSRTANDSKRKRKKKKMAVKIKDKRTSITSL